MTPVRPEDLSGDSWREYVRELRSAWQYDPELAIKYGVAAGNGRFPIDMNATTTDEDGQLTITYENAHLRAACYAHPDAVEFALPNGGSRLDEDVSRRVFLAGVGAAVAASAGAGTAAAQEDEVPTGAVDPNFDSDFTPAPWIEASATISEHTSDLDELGYVDNNGESSNLKDDGTVIADREDEETPHNPVRFSADNIVSDELQDFPRDEFYDKDGDGDADEPIRAVDATHWTVDESGTAGTMTVEDADDGALRVSTSSQGAGDVALATFSDFTIDSGEARKYMQLVQNIVTVETGVVVTFRVVDAGGISIESTIDPSADETTDSVIANAAADGDVYQRQNGDFTNGTDLDTIERLEIEVAEANAELVINGLNLEREGSYAFGRREFINADDELETKTVEEPRGLTGYKSLTGESDPDSDTSLTNTFPGATVYNVEYDVEILGSGLPDDHLDAEIVVPDRSDYDKEFHAVGAFDLGSLTENYDVGISPTGLYGLVRHPSSRYLTGDFAKGLDEVPTLEDTEDISWTSSTSTFEDGDHRDGGDEVELSTAIASDSIVAWFFEIQEDDDVIGEMAQSESGGGAPAPQQNQSFLSTVWGKATAVLTGTLGAVGLAKLAGGGGN